MLNQANPLLSDEAIYLYGLTHVDELMPEVSGPGIDGNCSVLFYRHAQLTAVVSQVSSVSFTGVNAEENLQNPEWLTQHACRYERVVEEIWQRAPIYPIRFGTLFSSWEQLAGTMTVHSQTVQQALNKFAECDEWAIKGYLQREQAQSVLWEKERRQHNTTFSNAAGVRHLQEQRLRKQISSQVTHWLSQTCQSIGAELLRLASELRQRQVLPNNKESESENVFNWAFLVTKPQSEAFLEKVEEFNNAWHSYGLHLSCTHWPPYSFCSEALNAEPLKETS